MVYLVLGMSCHLALAQEETPSEDYQIFQIYFRGGSYYVDEFQEKEFIEFIESIKDIENYTITIHSHTDNIGGVEFNEWLSFMRSESAIQLLLEQDIFREMISKKDFGQYNPVYDNSTWYGRMKNRRVDIIFWPIVM